MSNVVALIKEYGQITGRPEGWERYLSIEEYLAFKKAAGELPTIGSPPTFSVADSSAKKIRPEISEVPVVKDYPPLTESAKQDKPVKSDDSSSNRCKVPAENKEGLSELEIFKMLKE